MSDQAIYKKSVTANDRTVVTDSGGVIKLMVPFWNFPNQSNITLPPPPLGYYNQERDVILRASIHNEAMWAGAVGIAITKMASLSFEIKSEIALRAKRAQELFLQADGAQIGWVGFLSKNLRDFLTTDNGSFYEIVRASSAIGSRIVGLKHLDSLRCVRTGDPQRPVIYRDRLGRQHVLREHQVVMLSDMPDPSETYNGVGFCAASRAYDAIYKLASIEWYLREKVGGLHPLAIHIVNGMLTGQIEDAVKASQEQQISKGAASYMGAVIIGVPKDNPPELVTIPLAEFPDRFNRKEEFDISVLSYANSIGMDVQDLQPLTGQALGTGAQSQVLDDKSSGKGLSYWRKGFTHGANQFILDDMTSFIFMEKDYRDQERAAAVQKTHAEVSKIRADAGITTPAEEKQILVDFDDLPKEFLEQDLTPGDSVSDTDKPDADGETQPQPETPVQPVPAQEQPVQAPPAAKEAQGDVSRSVMVALFIPDDIAAQIAIPGGNPPEELHITLAYLGEDAVDTLDHAKLEAIVKDIAGNFPAITGVINGRGMFEVGDTNAYFLTYDAPALPEFRQALVARLKREGIPVVENHGFVPHITLTYSPEKTLPDVALPAGEITINALTLAWGGEQIFYPFQPAQRTKASEASIEEAAAFLERIMVQARKRKEAVHA